MQANKDKQNIQRAVEGRTMSLEPICCRLALSIFLLLYIKGELEALVILSDRQQLSSFRH